MREVPKAYVVWANRNKDGSVAEIGLCLEGRLLASLPVGLFLSLEAKEFTLETAPREQTKGGKWLPGQPLTMLKDGSGRPRFDQRSLTDLSYLVPQDTFEALYDRNDRCPPLL